MGVTRANGTPVRLPGVDGRKVQLVYVNDQSPGIERRGSPRRFHYVNSRGQRIRSPRVQARIRKLVIPPAWTEVWICSNPRGHLQATGRDARGRKQYLYHPAWQTGRNDQKFETLWQFGRGLARLRRQVKRLAKGRELTRETVLAAMIMLLDVTLVRVGNEEYVKQNDSFGLTTLRNRHATASGRSVRMRFRGKSGVQQDVRITSRRLSRIVRECQELPGQRLFQYYDESGKLRPVTSTDVNEFLRSLSGQPFTAKDFRTWRATAFVLEHLRPFCQQELTERQKKQVVSAALRTAATALGNTVTVCRKYYVHPGITDLFLTGDLEPYFARCGRAPGGLSDAERVLLAILREKSPRR
jgi:DNA topoisomerase I